MNNYGIYILLLLELLYGCGGNGEDCISDDRCSCYNSDVYEFQCPPTHYKMIIHASKNKKYISIDCSNLKEYDLSIFPNYNAGEKEYFQMRFCPLPTDNFQPILQALNISNIKRLRLEQNIPVTSKVVFSNEMLRGLSSVEILYFDLLAVQFEDDAFQNLPNLTQLFLERSNISDIGYMFNNNLKLTALHLSRNEITDIPDGLFRNLSNLRHLHLWGNHLTKITKNYFTGLKQLKSLELSSNNISFIDNDGFSELTDLVNISLRLNKLTTISSDIFKSNTLLEGIRLGNNPKLILPDFIFSNLPQLKNVNVEGSQLNYIPENVFSGSNNLRTVILDSNNFSTLPENLFQSKINLLKLDLSNNRISFLPDKIFFSLENLEDLYLQNNFLTDINEQLFESLINLKRLYLNKNKITTINVRAFEYQNNLITIDLSYNLYNMSYDLQGITPFNKVENLETINLSHNFLLEFPDYLVYKVRIKELDLSYNNIEFAQASSFAKVSLGSLEINLSHNNISTVGFYEMKILASQNIEKYDAIHNIANATKVDMSYNPFICDCRNFEFIQYIRGQLEPLSIRARVDIWIDNENTFCSEPKSFQHIRIAQLNPRKITDELRDHNCPENCNCFKRCYDEFIIVDCANKNLTVLPKLTFSYHHIELNLEGNMIRKGPNKMLRYDNVTNMFLSNNQIDELKWIPSNVEVLRLDGNKLTGIDDDVLKVLNESTVLRHLTLYNNSWSCGCSAVKLQNFIKTKYEKVSAHHVICKEDNVELINKDLCKSNLLIVIGIVVPILTFLLVLAASTAIYFYYKQEIKVWLYAKNLCLWFVTEEELDKNKKYDVFISFSHKDEDFVMQNLLPILESGPNPYKTCIHIRDWPGGEFITTQITNTVMNSRRTLVVLSDSFLESVWGKLEFRTAHTQAIEEGRARVIVVKYGDLNEEKLDEDLKAYLKTNTYVEWGKPWFWNKLKYALPHSRQPSFYHTNQRHANMMLKIDDKFDHPDKLELTSQPISYPESTPPVMALDPALLKNHPLHFDNVNCHTPPAEAPLISR